MAESPPVMAGPRRGNGLESIDRRGELGELGNLCAGEGERNGHGVELDLSSYSYRVS